MRALKPTTLLVPVAAFALCAVPMANADDPSPRLQLQASAAAFSKVKSYRLTITDRDKDGTSTIKADVTTAGRVDVSVTIGKQGTFRLRQIQSSTYLRGDARYWRSNGGREGKALARKLAGRWIQVAKSDAKEFDGLFAEVSPKRIAACLVDENATGTLSPGGTGSVGGTKAQILNDAGDKPGTAPGKLYIAAQGAPLPLRILQTGKVKPGGKDTTCTDPESTSVRSDGRLSRFNEKLNITTPKNAIKIPSTGSGSDSGSSSSQTTTA